MNRELEDEAEFNNTEYLDLIKNQAWKAFLGDVRKRQQDFKDDLSIPAKTKDLGDVRGLQGQIQEDRYVLEWSRVAENYLKLRDKEKENA